MSNQSGVCSFALLNFPFSSLLFYKSVGLLNHLPVRFDLTLTSQWHPSLHFVIFQIPHFSALIGVPYLSSACALFFDTGTSMAPRPMWKCLPNFPSPSHKYTHQIVKFIRHLPMRFSLTVTSQCRFYPVFYFHSFFPLHLLCFYINMLASYLFF